MPHSTDRRLSILLVEDNPDHQELLGQMLMDSGLPHALTVAGNLPEAERLLRDQHFDAILLDHRLGAHDSRDLLKTPLSQPIIVLTSYPRDELDEEVIQMGAADFLAKADLSPTLLKRTVRHALEREEQLRQLRHQSLHDPLTGVFNRRYFEEQLHYHLEQLHRHPRPAALCFLDMDNLKPINDGHGHAVGDQAIRHLARVVLNSIRKVDICARYGGDEFCLLLPELAMPEASAIIERIRSSLASRPLEETGEAVTASFGITELQVGDTLERAIRLADEALYRAKSLGKNQIQRHGTPP